VLLGPYTGGSPNNGFLGSQWSYEVVNSQGNGITGKGTMSEILFPEVEMNTGDPTATSFSMDFSQPFHDTIGVNLIQGSFQNADISFDNLQIFTATLNGTTYVLTSVIWQSNIINNGNVVVSQPAFLHP
jgi:hypothetical protein